MTDQNRAKAPAKRDEPAAETNVLRDDLHTLRLDDTPLTAGAHDGTDPDADTSDVRIKIGEGQHLPVKLVVQGVGAWSLDAGEHTLPADAVAALANSDVKFTKAED